MPLTKFQAQMVVFRTMAGCGFPIYLEQFQQLSVSVTQMEQLLESIHAQLNQYADTVADRDRQDATSFGLN